MEGTDDTAANLGQVFIAVDPKCFAPGFEDRMTDMNSILRHLPSVRSIGKNHCIPNIFENWSEIWPFQESEEKPVLVPGDPERAHMRKVEKEGGIQYHVNQLCSCDKLAERLNIPKLGTL